MPLGSPTPAPRVTVLTAVHNGERFVDSTITSVLAQSYSDFEYILIDDASVDSSSTILGKWQDRDARIHVIHNPRALNPAGALNRGLAEARGEYVAILDHDDLTYPTRLAEEVAFLDQHPPIGAVGGQALIIDEEGIPRYSSYLPVTPASCHWTSLLECPMAHCSVLVRRTILEQIGGYSVHKWAIPDFDLFHRLLQVTQISNLPSTLGAYRRWPNQLSIVHNRVQLAQVILRLQATYWEMFGFQPPLTQISMLFYAINGAVADKEEELYQTLALLDTLYSYFLGKVLLSEAEALAVRQDYAWRCLSIARNNHFFFRRASCELWARAWQLDPNLWTNCRQKLRNLRAKQLFHWQHSYKERRQNTASVSIH